ncbi:MAG: hypothetical protein HKP30_03120 [Myxococcales bacterium]|nr:hypothetical protein [Myxococcales bacterium]
MATASSQKTWATVLGLGLFALVAVDYVALKGERVAGGSVNLSSSSPPLVLKIRRPGVAHLVEISTRKHGNNESKGRTVAYRLEGPDGRVIAEDEELVKRKRRFFEFTPTLAGAHRLHVQEATVIGSGRGTGRVSVTIGDRRTISRWAGF